MTPRNTRTRRSDRRQRGAAAILAMMFLVIFGSLATAMAIVSQGNLRTADSHLKMNRSLSAAETGVRFLLYRLDEITPTVKTTYGVIDADLAVEKWEELATKLVTALEGDAQYQELDIGPYITNGKVVIPAIAIAPNGATFEATLEPHPLVGENYAGAYYQRKPYTEMIPPVSAADPLDARWVRLTVRGMDGPVGKRITRTIVMDLRIHKRIEYAILSKSRVMIGRNVMIEGAIGSRFLDTHLTNGHPVQVESDFRGLHADTGPDGLDARLDMLVATLADNDQDGDNRLHVYDPLEVEGIPDPGALDRNGDGYIDDYDFFLEAFDANADGTVTQFELEAEATSQVAADQFMQLLDTFGKPTRGGYNDGVINEMDRYAKIRGEVKLSAAKDDWENGAADGPYQEYFQGPIVPGHHKDPVTFENDDDEDYAYEADDFEPASASYASMATNDLWSQVTDWDGTTLVEEMPFGAAHPYDYYERPVFVGMTFEDMRIPIGTNALFIDCTFIGVTYVAAETNNWAPHHTDATLNAFHYSGMWDNSSGDLKHEDIDVHLKDVGYLDEAIENGTKALGNNIRFDNCTFHGSVVTAAPLHFSHTRNKLTFTGITRFDLSTLPPEERDLYRRSTLMAPNFSIEMGTFIAPDDATETVELSGTIVAGVLDLRGQVKITGTILTTFEPKAGEGPVLGDTSPNFNTTLGYFPSSAGDLEAELPANGMGVIQIRYDPTLPMPDGILGPISIDPVYETYFEGEVQ